MYENIKHEVIGVFNGENMVDENEKMYVVPANYASKSKLVEGDMLKLTLTEDGQCIYKQVGPVQRRNAFGLVRFTEDGLCTVLLEDGSRYKILRASVTYFKLNENDEVMIKIPKDGLAEWAVLDGVISRANVQ
jgi:hypothetical protein